MDTMSQVTVYFEKMYKYKKNQLENFKAKIKLQTDCRKLQNGKLPGAEANQLEKSPYTLDSAEPLPHTNCHVRNPPPELATRDSLFFGNRGAEIRTSRGDQKARPHGITTATGQELKDNPYRRNSNNIMLRRLTTVAVRVCHNGGKMREISRVLKPRQSTNKNK